MFLSRSLVLDVVRMALNAMWSNKMRSFLTVLGVIIGVGTVIAMGALVSGLDRSMARQIQTFGSHILLVRPFRMNGPGGAVDDSLLKRHAFTDADMEAVRQLPSVRPGRFIRPEDGRSSRSCIGTTASRATEAKAARMTGHAVAALVSPK